MGEGKGQRAKVKGLIDLPFPLSPYSRVCNLQARSLSLLDIAVVTAWAMARLTAVASRGFVT